MQRLTETSGDVINGLARMLHLDKKQTNSSATHRKPRVVVLGSGWVAQAFGSSIDTNKFDALCISPRSYFIFTPMLASAAVGTVEYRSITDPIRQVNPTVDFCHAKVTRVDFDRKTVLCKAEVQGQQSFEVPYDYLVLSIGMQSNTFNTPGVQEYCFFLKDLSDAIKLRAGIMQQFEAASLPGIPEQRVRQMLTFVVIGGGPVGVEMSAELFDFIDQDLCRYFPKLLPFVRKVLLHAGEMVLEPFDRSMRQTAMRSMAKLGIDLMMQCRVLEVRPRRLPCASTLC
jgi:NADH:ubiquinone reductase (non-electrogenic)